MDEWAIHWLIWWAAYAVLFVLLILTGSMMWVIGLVGMVMIMVATKEDASRGV